MLQRLLTDKTNPYLKERRLADVIAAITTLGTYKFYKLHFSGWARRITGGATDASHWEQIFKEHPEFFRVNSDDNKASLVWRRQFPRNFNVDDIKEFVPDDEIDGTTEDRISRRPLDAVQITALIDVAVKLHDRALEESKAGKWWIPLVVAILAFIGGFSFHGSASFLDRHAARCTRQTMLGGSIGGCMPFVLKPSTAQDEKMTSLSSPILSWAVRDGRRNLDLLHAGFYSPRNDGRNTAFEKYLYSAKLEDGQRVNDATANPTC